MTVDSCGLHRSAILLQTNPADWVLKLPTPGNCSVGSSNNEMISYDGSISQERENEDRLGAEDYK